MSACFKPGTKVLLMNECTKNNHDSHIVREVDTEFNYIGKWITVSRHTDAGRLHYYKFEECGTIWICETCITVQPIPVTPLF